MKRKLFLVSALTLFISLNVGAQVMEDDFETNQFGWTESSNKRGIAVIKDGVLHLESKSKPITSTCYAPIDVDKPFVLQVEALAEKIDDNKIFGILLDYEDDQNFILFYICEGEANLEVWRENKLIGRKQEDLKLKKGKKIGVEFEVEYNLNEILFKVNDVRAMAYRRRVSKDEFLLGTSGIGFLARGGQVIDFDNLKIIQ
jgi:hypothetical protein